MEDIRLSRYYLFKNASEQLISNNLFFYLDNKGELINLYKGSYIILTNIEELLFRKEDTLDEEMFDGMLDDNEVDALKFIDVRYISKSLNNIKGKILSINLSLQELQEKVITKHVDNIKKAILKRENYLHSLPKVFLSYAYKDMGLSFALFLYCLSHDVFLFVDWMWNTSKEEGKKVKEIIEEELDTSSQLLFTLTPASELNAHGYHTIRQWCAWEIGNFFTKRKEEKYYVNFYPKHTKNNFIDTLKPLHGIKDQRLY